MAEPKKEKYIVTMYLTWKGERKTRGDFIWLTPEEASRVPKHRAEKVEPIAGAEPAQVDTAGGSEGMDAKAAAAFITQASKSDLEQLEFLSPDEDRVTVLRAWDEKFGTDFEQERSS